MVTKSEKMIVKLPAVIKVSDYHEFHQAEYFFSQIGTSFLFVMGL
jgi:hypothetical protein